MRRREFISLIGGVAATWPLAARAQQHERMRQVGMLLSSTADDAVFQTWVGAFLQGLAQSGWVIGRNVRIETRWAGSKADDIRRHAQELAALAPDVILAHGGSTVRPLLQSTRSIPIVFAIVTDPVGNGYVESLARPGRNATGFMMSEYSLNAKYPELTQRNCAGDHASGGPPGCQPRGGNRRFCRHPGHGAIAQDAGKRDRLARSW